MYTFIEPEDENEICAFDKNIHVVRFVLIKYLE